MTSQRQLEANRANAKRSTGPRSQLGKARSRSNAAKHSLTAKLIPGENAKEFNALRKALVVDFAATMERELLDQLAGLLWRQRRCPVVEAALLKNLMHQPEQYDWSRVTDEELEQAEAILRKAHKSPPTISSLANGHARSGTAQRQVGSPYQVEMLSIFSRYEAGLRNGVMKTVTLLLALQAQQAAVGTTVTAIGSPA